VALKLTLEKLSSPLKVTVNVEGLSGDCVLSALRGEFEQRMVDRLSKDGTEYDLVIILGGTNDLGSLLRDGKGGATRIFEDGLRELYNYALEVSGASLMVMTVPMRAIDVSTGELATKAKEAREHLNELILNWAREQKERVFSMDLANLVPYVRDSEEEGGDLWSADGLHMSESGYDRVGELLAERIRGLLKAEPAAS
jgi:lysophospholipase L1-like esterase